MTRQPWMPNADMKIFEPTNSKFSFFQISSFSKKFPLLSWLSANQEDQTSNSEREYERERERERESGCTCATEWKRAFTNIITTTTTDDDDVCDGFDSDASVVIFLKLPSTAFKFPPPHPLSFNFSWLHRESDRFKPVFKEKREGEREGVGLYYESQSHFLNERERERFRARLCSCWTGEFLRS